MERNNNVTTIYFSTVISAKELPYFRGAIIALLNGRNAPLLCHNHTERGYRYRYPMVQYKIINGKATLVCIGIGADCLGQLWASIKPELQIGKRRASFSIENVTVDTSGIMVVDDYVSYSMKCWLPLNQINVKKYDDIDSVVDRMRMLESVLVGNILSMAKGLELFVNEDINVIMTKIDKLYMINYKGVRMRAMDVCFKCNVLLPDNIGLGKGTSIGMGTIKKM